MSRIRHLFLVIAIGQKGPAWVPLERIQLRWRDQCLIRIKVLNYGDSRRVEF